MIRGVLLYLALTLGFALAALVAKDAGAEGLVVGALVGWVALIWWQSVREDREHKTP